MPSCLICVRSDLTGGVRLSSDDVWLCGRCLPAQLPAISDPDELKLVLLLDAAGPLTKDQLKALNRLTPNDQPHARLTDVVDSLAQLRRLGLVQSSGGTASRTHKLSETGRLFKAMVARMRA